MKIFGPEGPSPKDPFLSMPDPKNSKRFQTWVKGYLDKNYIDTLPGMEDGSGNSDPADRRGKEITMLTSSIVDIAKYPNTTKQELIKLIRHSAGEISDEELSIYDDLGK